MTRNLVLCKHRVWWDFSQFQLAVLLELEDWCRAQRRIYWDRSNTCSASASLLWALILDLRQGHWKSHFSWRLSDLKSQKARKVRKGPCAFCHFEETANLIQVETSWCFLTLGWHLAALRRRPSPSGDGWWYWHWNTMHNSSNCQQQSSVDKFWVFWSLCGFLLRKR